MPVKLDQYDIKDLRKRAKMTQAALAKLVGVHRITVVLWENGKRRPSQLAMRQLHRLHKKLDGS